MIETVVLAEFGQRLVRVAVADARPSLVVIEDFRTATNAVAVDYNHVYGIAGEARSAGPQNPEGWQPPEASRTPPDAPPLRLGLTEAGLDRDHPCFANTSLTEQRDLDQIPERARMHVTAVASLLVGCGLPAGQRSDLYNASVLIGMAGDTPASSAARLVEALEWLIAQKVHVINMSISGPSNDVLDHAVRKTGEAGIPIVAAVGNDGPAAPPRYPAAYDSVVAVTAVDSGQNIYRRAVRGPHVTFSADGVNVPVAVPGGGYQPQSGTSLATPIVARQLAGRLQASTPDEAIAGLADEATDLGDPGRDPVYGWGYLPDDLPVADTGDEKPGPGRE